MNKATLSRLRPVFRIILSIAIILAGICLMAACLGIYHSGDQPFSREAVAAAFTPISIPVSLCLVLVVLSFVLELVLPSPAEKVKPSRQTGLILQRLQAKTDLSLCSDDLRSSVLAQRSKRRQLKATGWVLLSLCSVIFLSYGMNPHNFHQSQINDSMIRAMYRFVPCCLIPYAYGIYAAYAGARSMEEEIKLLKTAPAESKITAAPEVSASGKKLTVLRNVLLLAGIAILVYGYFTGGTADVLTKAVNICTECVGLG